MSNTTFAGATLASINKGKKARSAKVGVYGPPGIGKSSLLANAKNALFLDFDRGTSSLNVSRIDDWNSFTDAENIVGTELPKADGFKTLIIDSMSSAERLLVNTTVRENGWDDIESPGWARGYKKVRERWYKFLDSLDYCIPRNP